MAAEYQHTRGTDGEISDTILREAVLYSQNGKANRPDRAALRISRSA